MNLPLIINGDCLHELKNLPDNSIDAIITDPPYGLSNTDPTHVTETIVKWANGERSFVPEGKGFMGKGWDAFVPPPAVWDECFRVLKPEGFLLSFAGARTIDLMTLSIRLAGFSILDNLFWLYGTGFPKSLDVSKAVEAHVKTGKSDSKQTSNGTARNRKGQHWSEFPAKTGVKENFTPSTQEAQKWKGWGTALKPANEPIILACKNQFDSNFDSNFLYTAKARKSERPSIEKNKTKIIHPTVKPVNLMRWLIKNFVPKNGVVLDPFAGSGTTLEAAILETTKSIGIEKDPDYIQLIEQRVKNIKTFKNDIISKTN